MDTSSTLERLEAQLTHTKDPAARAEILHEILQVFVFSNRPDGKIYAEELRKIGGDLNSRRYLARAEYHLGIYERASHNFDKAHSCFRKAMDLFEPLDNEGMMTSVYINWGLTYYMEARFPEALEKFIEAFQLTENIPGKPLLALICGNLGNTYTGLGDYENALEFYSRTVALQENENDKKGLAYSLNNIGNIYVNTGNYDQALVNFKKSLHINEELGNSHGAAYSLHSIGSIYNDRGNHEEALNYFLSALEIEEEIGIQKNLAYYYNSIGSAFVAQGNYPEGMRYYAKSAVSAEGAKDNDSLAFACSAIADIHVLQGSFKEALDNYLRSLKISEATGNKKNLIFSAIHIGNLYQRHLNNDEEAEGYLREALKGAEEMGVKALIAAAARGLADVQGKNGRYEDALQSYRYALGITEEIGNKVSAAEIWMGIGSVYEMQGNPEDATEQFQSAYEFGKSSNHKLLLKDASLGLSRIYKQQNDFERALYFHENFHKVSSDILGAQTREQLTSLNFQHHMEQKEKRLEIEYLRNNELKDANNRSESLLRNILPEAIAEELKNTGQAKAKHYDAVSVLFTDFVGFTKLSEQLSPQELVDELHACFSAFDEIIAKNKIEKIKTVGDAYLAVAGLDGNAGHALAIVNAAIEIRDFMSARLIRVSRNKSHVSKIRIGIHSGPVVAGIVGLKKFAYDIWGDTVNTAARMEQHGEAGKINLSEATYRLVEQRFPCDYRGEIEAKNKGKLKMYFVR